MRFYFLWTEISELELLLEGEMMRSLGTEYEERFRKDLRRLG
jgi:hypothetical protein